MSGHEDVLQRLLVGELDAGTPEARAYLSRHPEAAAELEAMRRVEAALERVAHERETVVREAERLEGAPGEALVEQVVHDGRRRFASARSVLPRLALLAAAGLVLFLWHPWSIGPPTEVPPRGPSMGPELRLLAPTGAVDRLEELTWSYSLEPSQVFRVLVYDPDDPLTVVADSGELEESRWRPPRAQVESWPNPLRWEVQVLEEGRSVAVAGATLRRRSP